MCGSKNTPADARIQGDRGLGECQGQGQPPRPRPRTDISESNSPVDAVDAACIVEARVTEALVDLGRTELIVVPLGTEAPERVYIVYTRAAV